MSAVAAPTRPGQSPQSVELASSPPLPRVPRGPSIQAPEPPPVYYLVMRSKLGRGMDRAETLEYAIAETTDQWVAALVVTQNYKDDVSRRSDAALKETLILRSYDNGGIRRYRMIDRDGMESRVWVERRSASEMDDWLL
ncbi:hypothetical protein LZ554_000636 [Drepanopeziza brunnea f. sp. 'monogermtubi']|nr:hypothetical protein LZ554_000636 [Drepanopeziza brunnea f. sp. 'monogermtubi']